MAEHSIQRSFAAGEIAPSLYARGDSEKYQQGLRTCHNFWVQKHGGVTTRPGTAFVDQCKEVGLRSWLVPYIDTSQDQSALLEFGDHYLRVRDKNGLLLQELEDTPWAAGAWEVLQYKQTGGTIVLTDPGVAVHEFTRIGGVFVLYEPIIGPSIDWPVNLQVVHGGLGTLNFAYKVSAGAKETFEESFAPDDQYFLLVGCLEGTTVLPHKLSWNPVAGAAEYYIYKDPFNNGAYGYIGTAVGKTEFNDVGFAPDYTVTPPLPRDIVLQSELNWPRVSGVYQQRRFFANTHQTPEHVYGSRIGFVNNYCVSSPIQEDDAVTFRISANTSQVVRQILSMDRLVILTESGEWLAMGEGEGGTITPTQINMRQIGHVGCSYVRPVVIGNTILFLQARGSVVRDLNIQNPVGGSPESAGRDMTVFSGHLFEGHTILKMDYAQNPNSTVWFIREDGVLLSLTYLPEHDTWGWARHDTGLDNGDLFEDVCVVPNGTEDVVYVVVKRTVEGEDRRYIERLMPRLFGDESWYLDAGAGHDAGGVAAVAGLDHLEGRVVAVIGDGQVVYDGDPEGERADEFRVTGGHVNIPGGLTVVRAGLRIKYEIETLDLDVAGSTIRGNLKRIQGLTLLVERSSRSFHAGAVSGTSEPRMKPYQLEFATGIAQQVTGSLEMNIECAWRRDTTLRIEQRNPLPLTVLGILPYLEMGGA